MSKALGQRSKAHLVGSMDAWVESKALRLAAETLFLEPERVWSTAAVLPRRASLRSPDLKREGLETLTRKGPIGRRVWAGTCQKWGGRVLGGEHARAQGAKRGRRSRRECGEHEPQRWRRRILGVWRLQLRRSETAGTTGIGVGAGVLSISGSAIQPGTTDAFVPGAGSSAGYAVVAG